MRTTLQHNALLPGPAVEVHSLRFPIHERAALIIIESFANHIDTIFSYEFANFVRLVIRRLGGVA